MCVELTKEKLISQQTEGSVLEVHSGRGGAKEGVAALSLRHQT